MSARDVIADTLSTAVHAPSGDNSQPWEFKRTGNSVLMLNRAEGDPTLYNFRQRGSYLSHGAVAENIAIAAAAMGFQCDIIPFPGVAGTTAEVRFTEAGSTNEPLRSFIERRATNRKPYDIRSLDGRHRDALLGAIQYGTAAVKLIEDRDSIEEMATAVSQNERLLFENRLLHDFLFDMIRWTATEERAQPGLYVKTMEFPLPLQFMFRYVFRHWWIVRLLNRVGLSSAIPKQSALGYAASSAIGAVIIDGDSDTDFFNAGRTLQRMWLTAASLGVSLQPITAMPYLMQRVEAGEADMFNSKHIEIITKSYARIASVFEVQGNKRIAMLFRIGYDGEPTARSHKQLPRIVQ